MSVSVEPRLLEDLLEALSQLQFPINPQIYHDAAVRFLYADLVHAALNRIVCIQQTLGFVRGALDVIGFERLHAVFDKGSLPFGQIG